MDGRPTSFEQFRHTRRGVNDVRGVSLRGGTIAGAVVAVGMLIAAIALFA